MIKEKVCGEFGSLNFRMPNIPEAMILLGKIGLNSKTMTSIEDFENNQLFFMGKLIESLEPFISDIKININGKAINTYQGILMEFAMMPFLAEIATELFTSLHWSEEKKA